MQTLGAIPSSETSPTKLHVGSNSLGRNLDGVPHDEFLRIFSWNVNKCDSVEKVESITAFLNTHSPHVAILSECERDIPWLCCQGVHDSMVVLWDDDEVDCEILFARADTGKTTDKYVSVRITPLKYKSFSFILHGVYGDPNHGLDLARLMLKTSEPWVMMGDFNLTQKSKKQMKALEKLTSSPDVLELSLDTFVDSKISRRFSKLDRIVCTSTFYNSFKSIKPILHASLLSDHQPLELSLGHPIVE